MRYSYDWLFNQVNKSVAIYKGKHVHKGRNRNNDN